MMGNETIVPGEVLLDEAAVAAATEKAWQSGLAGTSTRTATAVVAALYFPASGESQPLETVQGAIYDLVCEIGDFVAGARPRDFRRSLRTVLGDLDYLATAFDAGRRPRGTRMIGSDCLMALTGHFPQSLLPVAQGLDFSDFGQLQIGDFEFQQASLIPIARNSRLLAGAVHLASSTDKIVAVWARDVSRWPHSLHALGVGRGQTPHRPISSDRVRRLPRWQKEEIAELAGAAGRWLRAGFGIRDHRDPLRFDRASLVLPRASALILTMLAEAICPWPRWRPAKEVLQRIRDPHPRLSEACEAMQRSAYELIFDIIKRRTIDAIACGEDEFARRAEAVGLIDPHRHDAAFDRYAENHVRTFLQIRLIHQARVFLQKLFAAERIDMADLDATVDRFCGLSPRDFHGLGRWSDQLKAGLALGRVDRSHETAAKLGRSEQATPMFPPKLPKVACPRELAAYIGCRPEFGWNSLRRVSG